MAHQSHEKPVLSYSSISIKKMSTAAAQTDVSVAIGADNGGTVSFVSPYNQISITFTPNVSLSYYEARVTLATDDSYDVGVGELAYSWNTITGNQPFSFSLPINSSTFAHGPGKYRICLYAQSALNHVWDVTYLMLTVTDDIFASSDADGVEVISDKSI